MMTILIPSKNEPKIMQTLMEIDKYFPFAQVIIANDRYGYGKGWAVREALTEAKGDIICLLDADMDIHPKQLWRLMPFIEDYDIVVGKKELKGHLSRKILTFLSRIYIRILFGINVDTQTGIKIFKNYCLGEWKTDSYVFDIEILYKAVKNKRRIVEIPVEAVASRKMKLSSVWKCLIDSVKMRINLK